MAIDNAQFISELDPALPDNRDPRAEGAGQMRSIKTALKQSFPNVDREIPATAEVINYMTDGTQGRFRGEVTMFSGLVADIPTGWVICDGTIQNQYTTPDLRGKFIMGYDPDDSATFPERATGGANHPDLGPHLNSEGHALTEAEMPPHDHSIPLDTVLPLNETGGQWATPRDGTGMVTGRTGGDPDNEYNSAKEHSHGIEAVREDPEDSNSTPTFDNRPDFVVLIFICYVGVDLSE